MTTLQPLAGWPIEHRRLIRGLFADIDDTLTTDGRIPARVFQAMEELRSLGLMIVPITGRPAGWCDMIARTWPVDGVVGENGALAFRYDGESQTMLRLYQDPSVRRRANMERLAVIRDEVLAEIPGVQVAADQPYRETDLAIDFNEDVEGIPDQAIDEIVAIYEKHGATAKVSSIHVNGWFGSYDKLGMTKRFLLDVCGIDLESEEQAYVFVGDSPNDAPMFGYFTNSVGVANLEELKDRCPQLPAWLTSRERSDGFVELAAAVLQAIR